MSSNQAVNDVFNAFVEAQKAMDKVPELEAQIAKHVADMNDLHEYLTKTEAELTAKSQTATDLADKLTASEAALAQATFRESELRDKLEVLLSTFKGVMANITDTVSLVEPKPEPIPEPEPEAIHTETYSSGQSEPLPISTPSGSEEIGPISYDETGLEPSEANRNTADPFEPSTTASVSSEAEQSAPVPSSSTESPVMPSDGASSSTEPSGQSEPNPPPAVATGTTMVAPSGGMAEKPFTSRPWWQKPGPMSWIEWIEKGGDAHPDHSLNRAAS